MICKIHSKENGYNVMEEEPEYCSYCKIANLTKQLEKCRVDYNDMVEACQRDVAFRKEQLATVTAERDNFQMSLQYIADDTETSHHPEALGMNRLKSYAEHTLKGKVWIDEFAKDEIISSQKEEIERLSEKAQHFADTIIEQQENAEREAKANRNHVNMLIEQNKGLETEIKRLDNLCSKQLKNLAGWNKLVTQLRETILDIKKGI